MKQGLGILIPFTVVLTALAQRTPLPLEESALKAAGTTGDTNEITAAIAELQSHMAEYFEPPLFTPDQKGVLETSFSRDFP